MTTNVVVAAYRTRSISRFGPLGGVGWDDVVVGLVDGRTGGVLVAGVFDVGTVVFAAGGVLLATAGNVSSSLASVLSVVVVDVGAALALALTLALGKATSTLSVGLGVAAPVGGAGFRPAKSRTAPITPTAASARTTNTSPLLDL